MRDEKQHDDAENTEDQVVIDTNICEFMCQKQKASQHREKKSGCDEGNQLLLDVGYLPLILVLLVLCLFVQVVKRQCQPVDGPCKSELPSTVVVQLSVDFVNDDVKFI